MRISMLALNGVTLHGSLALRLSKVDSLGAVPGLK
jgi:hypothetical protein